MLVVRMSQMDTQADISGHKVMESGGVKRAFINRWRSVNCLKSADSDHDSEAIPDDNKKKMTIEVIIVCGNPAKNGSPCSVSCFLFKKGKRFSQTFLYFTVVQRIGRNFCFRLGRIDVAD